MSRSKLVATLLGTFGGLALLRNRPEERATLLVRPDNTPAQAAYRSWGWYKLGELQPFDDAPVFDAMVRELSE